MAEGEFIPGEAGRAAELILRVVVLPGASGRGAVADTCVTSLLAQSEPGWELGRHWELVFLGHSVIGQAGVHTADPGPTPPGWTDHTYACSVGAEGSSTRWLLFTDGDSVHEAGAVSRAIVEAERYNVPMLSYAPGRTFSGLAERAVMPLVLSELVNAYPPALVNDPERRIATADRHFLLLRADAYAALGGYAAVAASRVPEVDLAFLAKRRKVALRCRYAPDAVRVTPAVSFGALWQEWTSTLALLIDNALALALWRTLDVALVLGLPLLAWHYWWYPVARVALLLVWARTLWRIYRRARKSNADAGDVALSLLGLPLFVGMLVVSWSRRGKV